ncbi:MAG TPA: type II toxin-antitoxin system RelE/ParE family toxin [Candidatus Dormibacteraeota bacterium]|nr:type II toxin-antitoxin system RelE/ParE family toxin [Candidatus Dormibacteraeota bacterium]
MPQTTILFFRKPNEGAPVWAWLQELRKLNPKAYAKCLVRVRRLAEMGHELRRPEADVLRDGIYELRARLGTVNYRLLYFFHAAPWQFLHMQLRKKMRFPKSR